MFNLHQFGSQIVVDLFALGAYAFAYVAAMVLRRGANFVRVADACATRLERPTTQLLLGVWGLAVAILVPWLAVMFFHTKVLGLLGLAIIPFAVWLVGSAVATASSWLDSIRRDAGLPSVILIALGAALPVLGWLVIITCLLPALGAIAEYLVSGGKKASSQTFSSDEKSGSSSTDLTVSGQNEDAA